jgi:hypothetical protein
MPAKRKKAVIVTLDDAHLSEFDNVADKCQAAGLDVQDSLEFLGQITGEIDPAQEDALRQIPGILSVEESKEVKLPPPDSDVQ